MNIKSYGKRTADDPSKAAKLANHTYLLLVVRFVLPALTAVAVFLLVRMYDKIDGGLDRINQNVTSIAINRNNAEAADREIQGLKATNVRQWNVLTSHDH